MSSLKCQTVCNLMTQIFRMLKSCRNNLLNKRNYWLKNKKRNSIKNESRSRKLILLSHATLTINLPNYSAVYDKILAIFNLGNCCMHLEMISCKKQENLKRCNHRVNSWWTSQKLACMLSTHRVETHSHYKQSLIV